MKNPTAFILLYPFKLILTIFSLVLSMAFVVQAAEPTKTRILDREDMESQPQGVFYYRIEPSFIRDLRLDARIPTLSISIWDGAIRFVLPWSCQTRPLIHTYRISPSDIAPTMS